MVTEPQVGDEVIARAFGDYRHGTFGGANLVFTRYVVVKGMNGRLISDLVTPSDVRLFDTNLWAALERLQARVDEANKKVRRWRGQQRKLWIAP